MNALKNTLRVLIIVMLLLYGWAVWMVFDGGQTLATMAPFFLIICLGVITIPLLILYIILVIQGKIKLDILLTCLVIALIILLFLWSPIENHYSFRG